MNPEYKIQDRIDRYLSDEMNESEKLEFENQLSMNADLVNALKAQKVANKIVIGEELLKLKAQMSKDLGTGNYPGGSQNRIQRYLFVGSGVMVIAVVLYFLMKDRNELSNTKIVTEQANLDTTINYSQQPVDSVLQNSTKEKNDLINQEKTFSIIQHSNSQKEKQNYSHKNSSCTDSIINFSCQVRGTCLHKNEGVIEIDLTTIKFPDSALLFSVDPTNDFHKEPVITGLKSGMYTVYVKDSKQCLHELDVKVEVPIISCEDKLPKK